MAEKFDNACKVFLKLFNIHFGENALESQNKS